MSAYCTQSDIQSQIALNELTGLTDDSGTGNLDTNVLASVIAAASGYIDRKVGNVYDVPFNPVPPSVNSMALTIACYMLYRRRLVPDERNKFHDDYKDVDRFLTAVNKREEVLDLSAAQDFSPVAANLRPTIYGSGNFVANSM